MNSPRGENGRTVVGSETSGESLLADGPVHARAGTPATSAEVDVCQTSGNGLHESGARGLTTTASAGRLTSHEHGSSALRTVKPQGYPTPVSGVAGELLRAQGRHNMRPAHMHFMIYTPGFKTQFSQVYTSDDPHLETDAQFGVTRALVAEYVAHDGPAPDP